VIVSILGAFSTGADIGDPYYFDLDLSERAWVPEEVEEGRGRSTPYSPLVQSWRNHMAGEAVYEARCKQCDAELFTVQRGVELGTMDVNLPHHLNIIPPPDPSSSNIGTAACPDCGTINEIDLSYLDAQ
jgi:hypothetical protein